MRRLSENFVVMTVMMSNLDPIQGSTISSGKSLAREGDMSRDDKKASRLRKCFSAISNIDMKAVVPCLVLGSIMLSSAALFVVSFILIG